MVEMAICVNVAGYSVAAGYNGVGYNGVGYNEVEPRQLSLFG